MIDEYVRGIHVAMADNHRKHGGRTGNTQHETIRQAHDHLHHSVLSSSQDKVQVCTGNRLKSRAFVEAGLVDA